MKLQVLEAKTSDVPRLAPLFDAYRVFYGFASNAYASQLFLTERVRRADSKLFVAVDLESFQTIGFCQLYPSFSSIRLGRLWILEDLFVRGDMRRRGVASALLDAAVAFAKESHAVGLTLTTAHTNTAAQALYAKHGWKHDSEFQIWNRWYDS